MARKELLDYVYKACILPQAGYSFALNHCVPYTIIGVQEAHLATHYNPLYWACACLCCNAGNTVQDLDYDEDGESDEEGEETPQNASEEATGASTQKRSAPNYGKIAKAIADAQLSGVEVSLPDINQSEVDFIPDTKNNRIVYSLSTVVAVSDNILQQVIAKRPFKSLQDFLDRVDGVTESQAIGMIKAGCFDSIEAIGRRALLIRYVKQCAEKAIPVKENMTDTQLKKAIEIGMEFPSEHRDEIWMSNFKRWIKANQVDKASGGKRYHLTDRDALNFFWEFLYPKLNPAKGEWENGPNGSVYMKASSFDREYKKSMVSLMEYFNSQKAREAFAEAQRRVYRNNLWAKYCTGTLAQWEMEQLSFYHEPHELAGLNRSLYGISDFNGLPEVPETETYTDRKGVQRTVQKTTAIAGTVVHADNLKHIVKLLTTSGVVDVKFYAGMYNEYKQTISYVDPQTKVKTVIDPPWLKRGVKLLIYGFRREESFVVRKKMINGFPRSICRIDGVGGDGTADLKFKRITESDA